MTETGTILITFSEDGGGEGEASSGTKVNPQMRASALKRMRFLWLNSKSVSHEGTLRTVPLQATFPCQC
jgi:hypothetical protein